MKRLKKLLLLISVMACAFCFSFGLVACGHEHTFDTAKWEKDATNHWHPATCEHTDEKGDLAAHSYDATTGNCVCGAHEHKYNLATWAISPEGHYHAAICSDKADIDVKDMKDFAPHDTNGKNNTCSVCGYLHEHTFGEGWVKTDPQFHWHEVTCGDNLSSAELLSNRESGYDEHDWNKDNEGYWICKVCGYKHEHTYGEFKHNKDAHWKEDTCHHGTEKDRGEHTFTAENGYICECGEQHQHTFNTREWVADGDNGHYHPATCGHTEVKTNGLTEHNWDKSHEADGYWTCIDCEYKHEHTYAQTLTYDKDGHWYADTCNHGTKKGYASHSLDSAQNNTCECGYHEHTYSSTEWEKDDVDGKTYYHWHKVTCGHEVEAEELAADPKSGYALHDYDPDNENKCVCGEQHQHSFNNEVWVADGDNGHYHPATCGHDELKTEGLTNHRYDASYKCQDCQYQHTHKFAEDWTYDDVVDPDNHYHEALCGHEDAESETAPHKYNPLTGDCVCGKHQHVANESWDYDDSTHWHYANCEGHPDHSTEKLDEKEHHFVGGECEECGCPEPDEKAQERLEIYNLYNEYYKFYNGDVLDEYDWNQYLTENDITDLTFADKDYVLAYYGDDDQAKDFTLEGHSNILIRRHLTLTLSVSNVDAADREGLWGQIAYKQQDEFIAINRQLFDATGKVTLKFLPVAGKATYYLSVVDYDDLTPEEQTNEKTFKDTLKYYFQSTSIGVNDSSTYSRSISAYKTLGKDDFNNSLSVSLNYGSADLNNSIYLASNLEVGEYYRIAFESSKTSGINNVTLTLNVGTYSRQDLNKYTMPTTKYIAWDSLINIMDGMAGAKISISKTPTGTNLTTNRVSLSVTLKLERVSLSEINSAPDKPEVSLDNTDKMFYTSSATETVTYNLADEVVPGTYHATLTIKDNNAKLTDLALNWKLGERTTKPENDFIEIRDGEKTLSFTYVSGETYFISRITLALEKLDQWNPDAPMSVTKSNTKLYKTFNVEESGDYRFGFISKKGVRLNSVEGLTEERINDFSGTTYYIWDKIITVTEGNKILTFDIYTANVEFTFIFERCDVTDKVTVTQEKDTLKWEPVETPNAKYQVYKDGEAQLEEPTSETSYKMEPFGDTDNHNFWVTVVVGENEGLASNVILLPIVYSNVTGITNSTGSTTVSWSKGDERGAGYEIVLTSITAFDKETGTASAKEDITIEVEGIDTTSIDLEQALKGKGETGPLQIKTFKIRVLVKEEEFYFKSNYASKSLTNFTVNKLNYEEKPTLKMNQSGSDVTLTVTPIKGVAEYDVRYYKEGEEKTSSKSVGTANASNNYTVTYTDYFKGVTKFYATCKDDIWHNSATKVDSNEVEFNDERNMRNIKIYVSANQDWTFHFYGYTTGFYKYASYEIRRCDNDEVVAKGKNLASTPRTPYTFIGPADVDYYFWIPEFPVGGNTKSWRISVGKSAEEAKAETHSIGEKTPMEGENWYIYIFDPFK